MAVSIKDFERICMGIQVKDSNRQILARMFNKIQLTVFTLLVFVCCVVIFPIHCDLSDFL